MTAKFIRVTEHMSGGDQRTLLINAAHIAHIQDAFNDKDTHIRMAHLGKDGHMVYYFVKERADDIWQQINCDMSKPPIIMTAVEAAKFYETRNG